MFRVECQNVWRYFVFRHSPHLILLLLLLVHNHTIQQVDRMLETAVGGVDYWAINTDAQALGRSKVLGAKVLNIGAAVTRGLGAGGDPNVGRLAAEESSQDIESMVQGTDLCFITSGMGGGTGSGAVCTTKWSTSVMARRNMLSSCGLAFTDFTHTTALLAPGPSGGRHCQKEWCIDRGHCNKALCL